MKLFHIEIDDKGEQNLKNWKIVLVIILVTALAGNVYFWNYHYTNGIRSSYDSGFLGGKDVGYQLGYSDGNQSGYEHGYNDGNISGYQTGYSDGNYSGYDLGYGDGLETGYDLGFYYGNISGYQTGFSDGNETGFADGYIQGVEDGAGRGYTVRDPTYQEAIDFVIWDKTDENEYSENYTCLNFAAAFENNAFQAGYRCGFVYVKFPEGAHAIVCFNTTDYGIAFIEPQTDEFVTLSIGEPYLDDIIISYTIIW